MNAADTLAGRFVIDEVGTRHGGIGTIHRGRDLQTGRAVAIKVLQNTSEAELDGFVREALLLSTLDDPTIVRHVAHGVTECGEPYLVMEWLEGKTLADHLGRHVLTFAETLVLGRRASDALAFAHARGLVHRDIKPANLFLVHDDVAAAKLIDFGVARAGAFAADALEIGKAVGTIGYMAPEQVRGERDVDARADVFALGCVLFKCLVGLSPFAGDNMTAALAKTLFEDAPRLRDVCEGVPAGFEDLVARMLAKDAAHRPADGAELVVALDAIGRSLKGCRTP